MDDHFSLQNSSPPLIESKKSRKTLIVLLSILFVVVVVALLYHKGLSDIKKQSIKSAEIGQNEQISQDYYALDGKPAGACFDCSSSGGFITPTEWNSKKITMSIVHYIDKTKTVLVSDVLNQAEKDLNIQIGASTLEPFAFLPEFNKLYFSSFCYTCDRTAQVRIFGYDLKTGKFFSSGLQQYLYNSNSYTASLFFSSNRKNILILSLKNGSQKLTNFTIQAWDMTTDSLKNSITSTDLNLATDDELTGFYWLDDNSVAITAGAATSLSNYNNKILSYKWDITTGIKQPRSEFGIIDKEISPKLVEVGENGELNVLVPNLRSACSVGDNAVPHLYKYYNNPHSVAVVAVNKTMTAILDGGCLYNKERGAYSPNSPKRPSVNIIKDKNYREEYIDNEFTGSSIGRVIDTPISFTVDSSDGIRWDKIYLDRFYDNKIAHIILKDGYLKFECKANKVPEKTCSFAAWLVNSDTLQYQVYDAGGNFMETRQVKIPSSIFADLTFKPQNSSVTNNSTTTYIDISPNTLSEKNQSKPPTCTVKTNLTQITSPNQKIDFSWSSANAVQVLTSILIAGYPTYELPPSGSGTLIAKDGLAITKPGATQPDAVSFRFDVSNNAGASSCYLTLPYNQV